MFFIINLNVNRLLSYLLCPSSNIVQNNTSTRVQGSSVGAAGGWVGNGWGMGGGCFNADYTFFTVANGETLVLS